MRLHLFSVLALLLCALSPARGQSSGDIGDLFVNAYMSAKQGEEAEQAGNFKLALSKLREAARQLDVIGTKSPTWNPLIVDYRKKRTAEAIVRVQEKLAHFGPGKGNAPEAPPSLEPALPEGGLEKPLIFPDAANLGGIPGASQPPPPARSSPRGKPVERGDDGDVLKEFKEAERRMKSLQADLKKARDEAEQLQGEKAETAKKLDDAAKAREASQHKQEVLQKRADNAETDLHRATSAEKADAEKIKALTAESADARRQLKNLKIEAEADAEYRQQLDQRYKVQLTKIADLTQQRDAAKSLAGDAPKKIEVIQKQLEQTKKEKEELAVRLQRTETQLSTVTQQRDDALAQVTKLKEAQKQVEKLVADNAWLMAKLADAQKSVAQFKAEGLDKDKQIDSLKKEVVSVKEQLVAARKESSDYQQRMGDLQAKLDESAKQLSAVKAENVASSAEKKKMQEENDILRGIVLRQQKKEAERQQTKKLVLGELTKLEITSKTLLKQIEFLSEPTTKLTAKERALFKKPELQVSDTEISILLPKNDEPLAGTPAPPLPTETAVPSEPKAPEPKPAEVKPVAVKPAEPKPAEPKPPGPAPAKTGQIPPVALAPKPPEDNSTGRPLISMNPPGGAPSIDLNAGGRPSSPLFGGKPAENAAEPAKAETAPPEPPPKSPDGNAPPAPGADTLSGSMGGPGVPPEFLPLAREGKDQFERGNYLEAEKIYRKILAKAPRNLYALSNIGVVLFKSGKYKLAEEAFSKAVAVAPEDAFSHCTYGIVLYQENKLDEAVNELTKALAINSKNPTAHNYLGITASQKGWPEAAQKELETAVSLDPAYADAYFNLAVVFATQVPPNKEQARKCYKRATELGAEADSALEQLIK